MTPGEHARCLALTWEQLATVTRRCFLDAQRPDGWHALFPRFSLLQRVDLV
eukprot:gene11421-biopygen5306